MVWGADVADYSEAQVYEVTVLASKRSVLALSFRGWSKWGFMELGAALPESA
jgi:hypothetical protein